MGGDRGPPPGRKPPRPRRHRREDWIALRDARDATLPLPDRIMAALQINLRGGRLPPAEDDGHHYLKVPVNRF